MGNINRLIWANGFTNDKTAYSNKEPYKKKCNKCKKTIWLKPVKGGWKPYDLNSKEHECKKPKNKNRGSKGNVRSFKKKCNHCDKDILLKMIKGKWKVSDVDGGRHRCDTRPVNEILDTDLIASIPK